MATGTFTGTIDGSYLMRQYLGLNGWNSTDTLNGVSVPALQPQQLGASGTDKGLQILPTINQTATAGATDFLINRTETATGSGSQLLADFQVGGTSKFSVDNSGNVIRAGTQTGGKLKVISGAAKILTAADSGALCLWNAAAGYLYTLPAPAVGLTFDFYVQTTITSVGAKVITNAGTVFLQGPLVSALSATTPSAGAGPKYFIGDGSSHVSINMYGLTSDTTSGGVAGSFFRVICISATQWMIVGQIVATGTIVTPFSNS